MTVTRKIDAFLWVEKYRPQTIEECILPPKMKSEIGAFIKDGSITNMLFSGTAGVGKTTLAKAICNQINADMLYINMSNQTSIDVIRTQIVQFASTASFEGNLKVVLGDEAERLSAQAQDASKGIIEEFHKNTRFIFTTNNVHKIIDPIRSRCTHFEFKVSDADKKPMMAQMMKRCAEILKLEGIEYETSAIVALVSKNFPDFRKTLNELQRYSTYGKIDAAILAQEATSFEDLVTSMKEKKFADVRKWVAKNGDMDSATLFRYFYENLTSIFEGKCIPSIILVLAQYQHYATHVVDQEINNIACIVEIMGVAQWK